MTGSSTRRTSTVGGCWKALELNNEPRRVSGAAVKPEEVSQEEVARWTKQCQKKKKVRGSAWT